MTFGNDSPPASPSADQQRDALRKGLGRAAQWAATGRLDESALLAACLTDQRYDQQVETGRGAWLWRMVLAAGSAERFRGAILHALRELPDERSVNQLCELARFYAEAGDAPFRTRLYEIVERKPVAGCEWVGEDEILALDGEPAFLFAAGVRGRILATDTAAWDNGDLVRRAVERFGADRVDALFASSPDDGVRRYWKNWLDATARQAGRKTVPSFRDQVRATTVDDVLEQARGNARGPLFRRWGALAEAADLRTVLCRLWAADEPKEIAALLSAFSDRALPEFDPRLIDLCRHAAPDVRRRAWAALEQNAHPLVREFALERLAQGMPDAAVVGLFVRNYHSGDEQRILEALTLPADEDDLHWLLTSVSELLKNNPGADAARLGLIVYASTPCNTCRRDAAKLLHTRGVAPEWLREECRHDAGEDCRNLFAQG